MKPNSTAKTINEISKIEGFSIVLPSTNKDAIIAIKRSNKPHTRKTLLNCKIPTTQTTVDILTNIIGRKIVVKSPVHNIPMFSIKCASIANTIVHISFFIGTVKAHNNNDNSPIISVMLSPNPSILGIIFDIEIIGKMIAGTTNPNSETCSFLIV